MGAAGALGISAADSLTAVDPAHADEASDVKIIKTSCRACIANCADAGPCAGRSRREDRGNPESPMSQGGVCAKGLAGIQALYRPNRNKYPMRRVGERGTNQWERISWEEALTEVATKINEISDKYGSGGHLRFHGWRRKPAFLECEALWRGHQHSQRVGAGLLAVLPAPHGRLTSGLRCRQAQQPVVLRLLTAGTTIT
ncbi:MAG: molybdopterin-dependent oxidoreductase [Adlercreutzia equolifaciens]